jgi:hypothetical protein
MTYDQPYLISVQSVVSVTSHAPTSALGHDGAMEEICFAKEAKARDYVIWLPWGHSQKADVCIWRPPQRPVTVQVKRGFQNGNSFGVYVGAARGGHTKKRRRAAGLPVDPYRKYKTGDFDVLAMYVPPADAFYFWRLEDICGQGSVSKPVNAAFNNWSVFDRTHNPTRIHPNP